MTGAIPLIAIVGRTNVGKSTLFNRIAGHRIAIVEDTPGVTRDRSYALVHRHERPFTLVDTGGLVGEEDSPYADPVRAQTEAAMEEADLIIAVLDGQGGLHPQDTEVASLLRRATKPVLWVINKCEKELSQVQSAEFFELGIDNFQCISALHGVGVTEFMDQLLDALPPEQPQDLTDSSPLPIKIAIVGKPNTGKSTLVNTLLGQKRMVTSAEAGTTRDSILIPISYNQRPFALVDTAGLRRKSRIEDHSVERFSNLRTLRALASCDVAVLLLDASQGAPAEQDAKIASLIHERGRGLLIAVNKWDAVDRDYRTAKEFKEEAQRVLRFAAYAPFIYISALTGKRCRSVLEKASAIYANTQRRVKTSDLNRSLSRAFQKHNPPMHRGREVKLYFATQIDVAPPTFLLFVNYPQKITPIYQRYIKNALQEEYAFEGVDVKVFARQRSSKDTAGSIERRAT